MSAAFKASPRDWIYHALINVGFDATIEECREYIDTKFKFVARQVGQQMNSAQSIEQEEWDRHIEGIRWEMTADGKLPYDKSTILFLLANSLLRKPEGRKAIRRAMQEAQLPHLQELLFGAKAP